MKQIPFFNYPKVYTDYKEKVLPAMEDVMDRGAFILQKEVETFENKMKELIK